MNYIFAFRVTGLLLLAALSLMLLVPARALAQGKHSPDEKLYSIPYDEILKNPELEAQAASLQPRTKKQQIWLLNFQIAKDDEDISKLKERLAVWRAMQQLGQAKIDNLAENIANIEVRTKILVEERDKRLKRVKELDDTIAEKLKRPLD